VKSAEGAFTGTGGVRIAWRRLEPDAPPRGVVVVAHGYAEHCGRYLPFAEHLASRGIAAVGLDHRGHGTSGGPRGHCRDFEEYVADVRTLVDLTDQWWPGVPRVLFGHSMGGVIAFLYLLRHGDTVRAGALSSPAFVVSAQGPRWQLRLVGLLARIVPRFAFTTALVSQVNGGGGVVCTARAGQAAPDGYTLLVMDTGNVERGFDGQAERELGFAIYSPCQVTTTDEAEGVTTYPRGTRRAGGTGQSGRRSPKHGGGVSSEGSMPRRSTANATDRYIEPVSR
jgi:pimeloyl-ACP methyl ester carboxylesterase